MIQTDFARVDDNQGNVFNVETPACYSKECEATTATTVAKTYYGLLGEPEAITVQLGSIIVAYNPKAAIAG